ncbi:hypothetical protein D3C73_454200 [compost metagenome]
MLLAVSIAALQALDLFADSTCFLFTVPCGVNDDLLIVRIDAIGEQRLAEPAFIMGDQMAGGAQDMLRGTVVALQLDDPGARKILFEAQDVVDFRTSPSIDRLVVVTDAADVLRYVLGSLCQQAQPHILCSIGVLILVDQNIAEFFVIFLQQVRRLAKDRDRMQQKVAKVAGVERSQADLIGRVKLAALAIGECAGVAFWNIVRQKPLVLPAVDHAGELFCRPALVVQPFGLDQLFDQPDHVIRI